MGQKITCNPQKLSAIQSYLQKSRVAHNIKDLEKHLPSVASINGMQVKDYLQALSDENMINVEKIGSGNWYWSFASENKKIRQKALENAKSTHDKAAAVADDLKQKLAEAQAQREEEEDMLDSGAETREELVASKAVLESEVKDLQKQLAAYTDTDPTEVERKVKEVQRFKAEAEQYTDDIYSIEGWLKQQPVDEEALKQMRMNTYGDQLDEEEGVLKELV